MNELKRIKTFVEQEMDISNLAEISRDPYLVYGRQIAFFLAKKRTKKSLTEIGKVIGGKDHSTVIYSLKQVEKYQTMKTVKGRLVHQDKINRINNLKNKLIFFEKQADNTDYAELFVNFTKVMDALYLKENDKIANEINDFFERILEQIK